MNTGLAQARGVYVTYLDDDDLYLPAHLETLVRFLDGSDEYRAAYTSVRQLEMRLGEDGRYRDGREITVYGRPYDAARLLYKNDIPLIGLAHRRALVDEVGGFDESFDQFEDWDFLIRLSARTRFHHLPAVTAVYRLRNDASNITAAQPWHSGDAQSARRRVFEKHAARRSVSTELALVDSLEADFYAVRDAAAASRSESETLRRELEAARAALAAAAAREADAELRTGESATREQALAVQNAHLARRRREARGDGRPDRPLARLAPLHALVEAQGAPDAMTPENAGVRCDLVIPVYNALRSTRDCLASVRRFAPPWARVVVVNDGSDARTTEFLRAQEGIVLLENETNLGFVKTANRGLLYSDAPLGLPPELATRSSRRARSSGWSRAARRTRPSASAARSRRAP